MTCETIMNIMPWIMGSVSLSELQNSFIHSIVSVFFLIMLVFVVYIIIVMHHYQMSLTCHRRICIQGDTGTPLLYSMDSSLYEFK